MVTKTKPKIKALITGITGQDGSYLAELLLSNGYEVHGILRRSSSLNTRRIDHLFDFLHLHSGDLLDGGSLTHLIRAILPDEVYNLAAQSHVRVSFDLPSYTGDVVALGAARLLDALRYEKPDVKYYQASSSEMFGNAPAPQSEHTPFEPVSPYACAKLYAYHLTKTYREAYGMFACNGILFNHASPRRPPTFVTRKITRGLAEIMSGRRDDITLGNLQAQRDWGYAPDYVDAMWRMLQTDQPGDYVIGTGEAHSVEQFLEAAFGYVGLDWRKHVRFNERYTRPNEVNCLRASPLHAGNELGWEPVIWFDDLVKIMVDADQEKLGLVSPGKGRAAIAHYFGGSPRFGWHRWEDQLDSME